MPRELPGIMASSLGRVEWPVCSLLHGILMEVPSPCPSKGLVAVPASRAGLHASSSSPSPGLRLAIPLFNQLNVSNIKTMQYTCG